MLNEPLGKLALLRDVVQIADVVHAAHLGSDSCCELRVRVAQRTCADACNTVQVLLAGVVRQPAAFALFVQF